MHHAPDQAGALAGCLMFRWSNMVCPQWSISQLVDNRDLLPASGRLILYGSPAMKIVLTQSSSSRNSIVTLAATRRRPRGRAGSWGSWLWVDIVSTPPPPSPPLPPALASRSEIGGRVLQQPLFFKQQQLLLIRIDRDSCFFPSAFWSVTPAQWTRGKQLQQGCKLICLPAGEGSLKQASSTAIAGGSYSKAAAHAYSSSTAAVDPGICFPVNLSGHYNHLVIPPSRPIPWSCASRVHQHASKAVFTPQTSQTPACIV